MTRQARFALGSDTRAVRELVDRLMSIGYVASYPLPDAVISHKDYINIVRHLSDYADILSQQQEK